MISSLVCLPECQPIRVAHKGGHVQSDLGMGSRQRVTRIEVESGRHVLETTYLMILDT